MTMLDGRDGLRTVRAEFGGAALTNGNAVRDIRWTRTGRVLTSAGGGPVVDAGSRAAGG
jgi:hypothetical protein